MSRLAPLLRETRATLGLAVPLALTQLTQMAMSFVDVMMIGRLGEAALAGGVVGSTVYFTVVLVCGGVVMAVNPMVAQAAGAGRPDEVGRAVRQGLWLAVLLGVPLIAFFQFAEPLLLLARQAPETAALAAGYLGAIRWGIVPMLGFWALRGLFEGLARPRPVLAVMLGGAALNVAGNWVLMFGKLGFPALGLVGTGWSSAFAMTATFVMLGALVRTDAGLRRYRVFAGFRTPDRAMLGQLVRLGWPIGAALGLEGGLFTTSTLLMGLFGTTALAAHQVALNAASVTFMVPLGIGMAATVRVGHAVGAGRPEEAARAGAVAIGLGAAFMLGTAVLFWTRPEWVVWVYTGQGSGTVGPEVAELAALLLGVAAVFQLFDGTQTTAAGALRGLKDTRAPMVIGAIAYWGIGFTAAVALGFGADLGAPGIWWGLTAGLAAAAVLLVGRFRVQVRRAAARAAGQAEALRAGHEVGTPGTAAPGPGAPGA